MNERRAEQWLAPVVATLAFATYATTMCRTIYWGDGIELTTAAAALGVPHPTGYPLFMLLGKVFAQIPLGTIAFRLNLMSAATATALAALVAWTAWRLIAQLGLLEPARALPRAVLAAAVGLTVAFSQTIWYHAGLTEVYLLNALLFASVFHFAFLTIAQRSARSFLAVCLLTALALGNHTMAIFLMPALAVLGVWLAIGPKVAPEKRKRRTQAPKEPWARRLVRLAAPALLLGIAGLSIYLYLPIRAAENPPLNWGDPSSADRFLWTVSGGEFRRNFFLKFSPAEPFDAGTYPPFLVHRLAQWLAWSGNQIAGLRADPHALRWRIGVLLLAGAVIGWIILYRRSPILSVWIAIVFLLNLLAVFLYGIPDIEGYFFPLHLFTILCLFMAFAWVHQWAESRLLAQPSAALAFFFLALPAAAWLQNRSYCDLAGYEAPALYGRQILERLPRQAMLLTTGDNDIYPLWYQQIVERRRPDVVVFGTNFLATPSYARYFQGRYDPPVAVTFFQQTPREDEYFPALRAFLAANMARRPLYATWYDPRMNVEAEAIVIPVMQEIETLNVPERPYLPRPQIYRLHAKESKPQP